MKKIGILLARLVGAFFILLAVGVLFFDKEMWMMIAFAVIGSFILLASFVWPNAETVEKDEKEDNRQPAIIINPNTLAPDFEGYRPGDGDIPQQQPAGELYVREKSAERVKGEFDDLVIEDDKESEERNL